MSAKGGRKGRVEENDAAVSDKKQLVLCWSLVAEVDLCCMRNLEVNRVILKSLNKVFSVYEEEHF